MGQQTPFEHLLLTRFNVRRDGSMQKTPDEAWLAHRFDLFERFCLPSLCAQTCQGFRWIVFFDEATPDSYRSKIEIYAKWPNFQPLYVDRLSLSDLATVLEPYVQAPYLITTRLDNDDALSKHFIERLQAQFTYQEFEFVNFADGYTLA